MSKWHVIQTFPKRFTPITAISLITLITAIALGNIATVSSDELVLHE